MKSSAVLHAMLLTIFLLGMLAAPADIHASPASPAGTAGGTGWTYVVQWGDTFSGIAYRYGLTVSQLWAANPHIWDINRIFPGQVLYIPTGHYSGPYYPPAGSEQPLVERSTDGVPEGTPTVKVRLVNAAAADVYVSLQGTTKAGVKVIHEYPVEGSMSVKLPAGWYTYVAWAGGKKFAGQFNMRAASDPVITFYANKVVVE